MQSGIDLRPELPVPAPPRREYMTNAQLAISGLGLVFSLLGAAVLALLGLVDLAGAPGSTLNVSALFSTTWICLLTAALAVPSLITSIQRLGARAPSLPQVSGFRLASVMILLWPLVLFFGNVISRQTRLAWLLLPPLQLLAVGLPVWWLIEIAGRKLPLRSLKRGWGVVNFSLFITTPTLMVVEILVVVALVIGFAFWASTQPALVASMQRLIQGMANGGQPNPDAIMQMLAPYLQSPLFIFGALAFVAGLIPLIEELLKPLAVWFLAGRRLTPAEGFVAGALCGGSFALLESLLYLSNPIGEGWSLLAAGRAGTELLHITTTALIGWALAYAWQNGAYLRLGLTYLLGASLHGLWNALTVLTSLPAMINNPPASLRPLLTLARIAPAGIVILVFLLIALLWGGNRILQNREIKELSTNLENE